MHQVYSGAGNTFIMVSNLDNNIIDRTAFVLETIAGEGKGIDGVILLEKSDNADFKMNYFNRDGTGDALCGNGLRCTAKYIAENSVSEKQFLTLEAVSRKFDTELMKDGTVNVAFPPPVNVKLNFKLKVHFEGWWELLNCSYVDIGSPHIIVFTDEIEKPAVTNINDVKVIEWGRNIRMHKDLMPEGANVNFIEIMNAAEGLLSIRSYERGVEGETLACGTGALSAALVFYAVRGGTKPVTLITRSGEALTVDLEIENRKVKKMYLRGNAERIR